METNEEQKICKEDKNHKRDLNLCMKEKKNLEKSYQGLEEQLENKPVCDVPYFKQYVRAVLEKLPSASETVKTNYIIIIK